MDHYSIKQYTEVSEALLECLGDLEQRIFDEPYSVEKIRRELTTKHNLVALVAYEGELPCGFKVGYELATEVFFSWIGGVVAECRRKGIAGQLMDEQHSIVRRMGYKSVRTHTENRFRSMLLLNIKSGFDVVGIRNENNPPRSIILLQKDL